MRPAHNICALSMALYMAVCGSLWLGSHCNAVCCPLFASFVVAWGRLRLLDICQLYSICGQPPIDKAFVFCLWLMSVSKASSISITIKLWSPSSPAGARDPLWLGLQLAKNLGTSQQEILHVLARGLKQMMIYNRTGAEAASQWTRKKKREEKPLAAC